MIDSSIPLGNDMEAREAMFTKFSHLLRHDLTDPHGYSSELKGDNPDTSNCTPTIADISYGGAEFSRTQARPFTTNYGDDKDYATGGFVDTLYRPILNTTEGGNPDTAEGFVKLDSGKPRMSLVDPDFVKGLADILTFGAQKYEADNWKLLDRKELYRYKDALLRHMYAYLGGELTDEESGRPHLDCVAFNLMALRYFEHGAGFNKGG